MRFIQCLSIINPITNEINYQNIRIDNKCYEKRRKKKSFTYHILHNLCLTNESVLEDDYENALQEYIYYSQKEKNNITFQMAIGNGKKIYKKLIG